MRRLCLLILLFVCKATSKIRLRMIEEVSLFREVLFGLEPLGLCHNAMVGSLWPVQFIVLDVPIPYFTPRSGS